MATKSSGISSTRATGWHRQAKLASDSEKNDMWLTALSWLDIVLILGILKTTRQIGEESCNVFF